MSCDCPFNVLRLVCDPVPGAAALNMALDEVLLGRTEVPLLRVYGWQRPAVSFGYFEAWAAVQAAHPEREAVRRWTGGGVVLHGEDWTYSLLVPRSSPMARVRPEVSYRLFHEWVGAALAEATGEAAFQFAAETAEKVSHACFENAARNDLLVGGRKVAGAAQRRTRQGVLHQGSLLGVCIPEGFAERLAGRLAREVVVEPPLPEEVAAAEVVAASRYATAAWLEKF